MRNRGSAKAGIEADVSAEGLLNYPLTGPDISPGVPIALGQVAVEPADGKGVQALLSGVVESAMDAIIAIDGDHRIIIFNAAAEGMFRCSAEEAMGQTIDRFIPERFRLAHPQHVEAFKHTGTTHRHVGGVDGVTIFGLRTDGEEFPGEAAISHSGSAGETVCTVVLRDITERIRAQEALALTAAELSRSNTELEQFAYVASHDLKEPLRMVTSYLQLLERRYKGSLDDDAGDFIEFAVDGATRMRDLIDGLLAYSRIGTHGEAFHLTDANATLNHAVANLETAINECAARITHDELPIVMGDGTQLEQLFQNLIGNAIKFRKDRPPEVHVGAKREGQGWLFFVQDNGIGLDPQYAERIFVIFQRLHGRGEYAGTGIGLAICRKIVERHGGRIWVKSRPGRGATFYFTIHGGSKSLRWKEVNHDEQMARRVRAGRR